jgi:Zn-dependent peptidase ImmA (M78 family)
VRLDRIEIEEAGANPARQASEIHAQLGLSDGPVPVFEIARALDITEIRVSPLKGFEAALVTTPERDTGAVALNAASSPGRRNFSLAHELGHFLNPYHCPVGDGGFECSRRDMIADGAGAQKRHLRQEAEANRFAIELLAPPRLMKPALCGDPEINQIITTASRLDISKTAAARRYVELHDATLAVVFSRHGKMTGFARRKGFPFLVPRVGGRMPGMVLPDEGSVGGWDGFDVECWVARTSGAELFGQTLAQANGHTMTLLSLEDQMNE